MPLYENIGSAVLIIRSKGILEICWSYIVNEVKEKKNPDCFAQPGFKIHT
jgi:hypothetical protein